MQTIKYDCGCFFKMRIQWSLFKRQNQRKGEYNHQYYTYECTFRTFRLHSPMHFNVNHSYMLKLVTRIGIKVQSHIYYCNGSDFEGKMTLPQTILDPWCLPFGLGVRANIPLQSNGRLIILHRYCSGFPIFTLLLQHRTPFFLINCFISQSSHGDERNCLPLKELRNILRPTTAARAPKTQHFVQECVLEITWMLR